MASARSLAPPRASASSRTLRQAACTALPTLAIVIEPPCTGALGSRVSPSVNFTRSIGRPRVSAATCVIDVQVPGPMSLAALVTSAVPSGRSRAIGRGGRKVHRVGGGAMPQPISQRPSRIERGSGLRRLQPKRSAAAR